MKCSTCGVRFVVRRADGEECLLCGLLLPCEGNQIVSVR